MATLSQRVRFVHVISLTCIVFVFLYFFAYSFTMSREQRADSKEINIAMISTLSVVLGYWVGSSAGSSRKDNTIAGALSNAGAPSVSVKNAQNVNAAPQDTQGSSNSDNKGNNEGGAGVELI